MTKGIIVTVVGGLLLLSNIKLAFTQYKLKDAHEFNVAVSGCAIALLVLAVGLLLIQRSNNDRPPGE